MDSNADLVRAVMAWAHVRLGEDLDVPALAGHAGYSVHHFSRLFTAVVGLPPAEWVQRARIARAADLLATTDLRVVDVALECGFKDAATFSRAFRRVTGASPAACRSGSRPVSSQGLLPLLPEPRLVEGGRVTATRRETLARMDLVGLAAECRGEADAALPARLWSQLIPEARRAGVLPASPSFLQLAFWEEDAEEAFTCLAGFISPASLPPPLPFVALSLPATPALVFTVPGPPEAIGAAYGEIYSSILPPSVERPSLRFALERYPCEGITEICFPLARTGPP